MAILVWIGIIAVFLLVTAALAAGRRGLNHLLRYSDYSDRTNPIDFWQMAAE